MQGDAERQCPAARGDDDSALGDGGYAVEKTAALGAGSVKTALGGSCQLVLGQGMGISHILFLTGLGR